MVYTEAQALGF